MHNRCLNYFYNIGNRKQIETSTTTHSPTTTPPIFINHKSIFMMYIEWHKRQIRRNNRHTPTNTTNFRKKPLQNIPSSLGPFKYRRNFRNGFLVIKHVFYQFSIFREFYSCGFLYPNMTIKRWFHTSLYIRKILCIYKPQGFTLVNFFPIIHFFSIINIPQRRTQKRNPRHRIMDFFRLQIQL